MKQNFDKVFEKSLEDAILGAILMCDSESVRSAVMAHALIPTDFQYEHNQYLFRAILQCWSDKNHVDLVSINAYKPPFLKGWEYANTEIATKHISVATLDHTILKFKEFRIARFWHKVAQNINNVNWATKDILSTSDMIVRKYDALFKRLTDGIKSNADDDYVTEITQKYLNKQAGVSTHVPTGCASLDELLKGGLVDGELIVLAGRPGQLKSTIALIIAWEAHLRGHAVVFYSIEMPKSQIKSKIISRQMGVDYEKIKQGEISSDELQIITQLSKKIDDSNFTIIDYLKNSDDILNHSRKMTKEGKCDIMFIDYIQLMKNNAKDMRTMILYNTRELKSVAKENKVPVVALSQVSRDVERRDNKRPYLSDLKESSSIEEDADVVLFPYREAYYTIKSGNEMLIPENEMWKVEINIGKGRDIGLGGVTLDINPITMKMEPYQIHLSF